MVKTTNRPPAAAPPMTKGEREDLGRLIRQQEKVLIAAAAQRSAELRAEFEQQMASVYSYDNDETWKAAVEAAEKAVEEAEQVIASRCRELGIPERFAPGLHLGWHGRGENGVKDRRDELRRVAQTRIAAIEQAAVTKIKMACLDAQTRITAAGLTSVGAMAFFESMPKVETLMPPLELRAVEDMLAERRADRRPRYLSYED